MRYRASAAWGHLGSAAATPAVLARLVALILDPNDYVRASAAEALGQMAEGLGPERAEWLAAWWGKHLANDNYTPGASKYPRFRDAAFDILHRLAARQPRTGQAKSVPDDLKQS